MTRRYDAVIVGSGPNGLAAGVCLAREGLSTLIVEAGASAGGGARSANLTLPGITHDVCSTVHPLGLTSPFFQSLGLEREGLSWINPPCALVHVLARGRAVPMFCSLEATAERLGSDENAYARLFSPLVARFHELTPMILGPLRFPEHPALMARFGVHAMRSVSGLVDTWFRGSEAKALLAGIAAHGMVPLHAPCTAAFALLLGGAAHAGGWPLIRGGSQRLVDALLNVFRRLGGELEVRNCIARMDQLPPARAYLFDVGPRQLLKIAGEQFPGLYRERLKRFRYGAGVFKMDWALRGPIPWRDPLCALAPTVHLSGDLQDIAAAERAAHDGRLAPHPFVLLVQPTLFDSQRAPPGIHVAWAYCHVPCGSALDASQAIETEIEEHAPGFRDLILGRFTRSAAELEAYDPNYVGGDINGGLANATQLFFRPVTRVDPYSTPAPHIFLCSSSTPPGGGVHGMCGFWAAQSALRRVFSRDKVEQYVPQEVGHGARP